MNSKANEPLEKAMFRYLKKQANEMQFEDFSNWFIKEWILKNGNRKTGMNIHKLLNCKNDTGIIYRRLRK